MKRSRVDMSPEPADVKEIDVLIAGAGPAGLMLATNLARFGINVKIIDDRQNKTSTGRADGLQPKTLETFRQMRIADEVLKKGAKIYDISFWNSYPDKPLHRTNREVHFPPVVDALDPYILLVHQGMVEDLFLTDMASRGLEVDRNIRFESYSIPDETVQFPVVSEYVDKNTNQTKIIRSKYLIGCDGAHSAVRGSMPGNEIVGESIDVFWGVLDGVIETDFPDLWSKCAIASHNRGTILCIPRERNMTRLYIELSSGSEGSVSKEIANQDFVMNRAKEIMKPFNVEWKSVEWFGVYQIGQRIAKSFEDRGRVFIAGDASHTHSPKAAQGMNVSMHDTWNLAWKLSLVLQKLASPKLLSTYSQERHKIASDLITFDYEHANAFVQNDAVALAENFKTNIRFISGIGAVYAENTLNIPNRGKGLRRGELLTPAKAMRFIDANPVDLQLDIPMLGQFRIYFLAGEYEFTRDFVKNVCEIISRPTSIVARASAASIKSNICPKSVEADKFIQPTRYVPPNVSRLFTFSIITTTPQNKLEFTDLPELLRCYKWTFYIDNQEEKVSPTRKWTEGGLDRGECGIMVLRPDGYVGAFGRWRDTEAAEAASWVEGYFKGALEQ